MEHVHIGHIQKKHDRQCDFKGQFVRRLAKLLGQKTQFAQNTARNHDQKDRQRSIQAENQILHKLVYTPPYTKTGLVRPGHFMVS